MTKVHFLGIGGSGASAVAAIAQAQGFEITGCDKEPHNEFTGHFTPDQLLTGHSKTHLVGVVPDILAITPAITSLDPNNEELVAAREQGIEVITWQQFMGQYLEKDKFVIAVCGTHGKSTTTAMTGMLLEDAKLDPTVELGANVQSWKGNFRTGKSKYFVTEADEFNDNFLCSKPDVAIVTTVEMDHPEFFKDFEDYKESFIQFLTSVKGTIIANMSDPGVAAVIKDVMKQSFPATPVKQSAVTVLDYSKSNFNLDLQIPGDFNKLNAAAVFQLGLTLGLEPEIIKKSLEGFAGLDRRFELIGQYKGAEVISDFGHHPTEIKVTLEAARQKWPDKKIWVTFQPHMFSRTKILFEDFVQVLKDAPVDGIAIMDIYPSREVDTGLVTSKQLAEAVNKPNVEYGNLDLMNDYLDKTPDFNGNVFIYMGAGDTDKWARQLVATDAKTD